MEREMHNRGIKATFRPTGQTGILITGDGVPLDAVIADFMAGSIEWLTPDNDPDHWDLIEGQGSLYHENFSLAEVFTIARGSRTVAEVLRVTATTSDGYCGQGECVPYARYGETLVSVAAQIHALPEALSRATLSASMPPGAADP